MHDAKALLDRFLGGPSSGSASSGADAGQFDVRSLLSGKGGLVTGALGGGLAGLLLGGKKTPRKLAGTALKAGGVALVGGLAYKAWRDWQAGKVAHQAAAKGTPALDALQGPEGTAFLPADSAAQDDLSESLMRAMIAAAKADGHVDDAERRRIAENLDILALEASQRAFIEAELRKPLDVGEVADAARCPEHAAEIYTASLLAIDPTGAAERGYLAMLAARLKLDPELIAHLEATATESTQREAA